MSELGYSEYVGRSREARDIVEPWRVAALAAALDLDIPHAAGDPLPALFHFLLFRETTRRSETSSDGHPRRGDFLPPVELPRRMFAGGRVRLERPILIGEPVERVERIASIDEKSGGGGRLVIARLAFEYRQGGRPCLHEERDIIYREGGGDVAPSPRPVPIEDTPWSRDWDIDPVLLFRYSALTFNSHRIHYDERYAREEEGYPDLVIHGPLIATLLCLLAGQGSGRAVSRFSFRAMKPFFLGAPVRLRGAPEGNSGARLRAVTPGGETGMLAEAEYS